MCNHAFFHKRPIGTNSRLKCTTSITDVPVDSLLSVIRDGGANSVNRNTKQISIGIEFNYLVCAETRSSNSLKIWAMKVVDLIECLPKCGYVANHIANPELRHHSKRASTKRRSEKIISSSKIRVDRFKINDAIQRSLHSNLTDKNRSLLSAKKGALEKSAKTKIDSEVSIMDVTRLAQTIINESSLNATNDAGGRVNSMITRLRQADVLISKRFKEGKSLLILSSDSDFLMCLGKNRCKLRN